MKFIVNYDFHPVIKVDDGNVAYVICEALIATGHYVGVWVTMPEGDKGLERIIPMDELKSIAESYIPSWEG